MNFEASKILSKSEDSFVAFNKTGYDVSDGVDPEINIEFRYQSKKLYNENFECEKNNIISPTNLSEFVSESENQIKKISMDSHTRNDSKFHMKLKNSMNNKSNDQNLYKEEDNRKIKKKAKIMPSELGKKSGEIRQHKRSFCSCTRIYAIDEYNFTQHDAVENKPSFIIIQNDNNIPSSIERNEISSQIDNYFIDEITQITSENKLDNKKTNYNTIYDVSETHKSMDTDYLEDNYFIKYDENMDLWFLSKKLVEIKMPPKEKDYEVKNKSFENTPISEVISNTLNWYEKYKLRLINDLNEKLR
ncbi:hypothetical protein FG386_000721 [Cryptosporidium ryanae]|uniref:uncharacterized protein n=1 Tax=Cryptosporidium ryanae TaxID=515981 RepID=UPI003519F6E9|nr:hypothetical protein FG386_000721 [Cryptosporidium ryanae]